MPFVLSWLYSQFFVTPKLPNRSFKGETIFLTGANRGLGLEGARKFVQLGASKVIIAVRSIKKGEEAKANIEKTEKCSPSTVEVWELDLASHASIESFSQKLTTVKRIDAFVANVGIMAGEFSLIEGHESTVAINVISTFLLAFLILPKLKETASTYNTRPRLVFVVSEAHHGASLKEQESSSIFKAMDNGETTNLMRRYQDTKLIQILVVKELFKSYIKSADSYPIIINMVNPGFNSTEFGPKMPFVFQIFKYLVARKIEVGSRTYVHAAAIGDEGQAKYLSDCHVEEESEFVRSEEGRKLGKRLMDELVTILEEIHPGVTKLI